MKGDSREKSSIAKKILFAVILGLAINIVLGFIFGIEAIFDALSKVDFLTMALPFFCIWIVYLIDSLRYDTIFRQFGIKLSFKQGLFNNIIGNFFSAITPSAAGGQPFQIWHFRGIGVDSRIATNVVMSRFVIYTSTQLIILIAFIGKGLEIGSRGGIGAFLMVVGILTSLAVNLTLLFILIKPELILSIARFLLRRAWVRRLWREAEKPSTLERLELWTTGFRERIRFLWSEKLHVVFLDIFLNVVDQFIWAFALWYPLCALVGRPLPFMDVFFAYLVCSVVSAYIPTPGASGSVEASYALILGGLTGDAQASIAAVLVWRFSTYYLHLPFGALCWLLLKPPKGVMAP